MPAWVEHWPSVATKTGQTAQMYAGWPTLYRHYACLESWASLVSGTVSSLPDAVTGQGYTLSGTLVTTAQNGTSLGSVSQGTLAPQGWDLITNGDLLFVGTPGLTFALCSGVSIASANATTPYTLAFGTTTILPAVSSTFWVYRLAWITSTNSTTISAGVAPYPNLPELQVVGSGAPITGCTPSFSLAQSMTWLPEGYALLGGAPLLSGTQKYSLLLTTPGTQYTVPYTLSYPSTQWYDTGASWQKRLVVAPSGQEYVGSPQVTPATSTTSALARLQTGGGMLMLGAGGEGTMVQVESLANVLSGDLVYGGLAGTSFPQFFLTPTISLQGTSTQVTMTIHGVTTPVATLPASGNWLARIAWTTSGNTTTLQAGAAASFVAPPTLAAMGSVSALTAISPQFQGGTWGDLPALTYAGTATPHFSPLAQLSVPLVQVTLQESASDTENKTTTHLTQETGVEYESQVIAAAELVAETALGAELLTLLGKLILHGTAQGSESLVIGQPKGISESGSGSETLAIVVSLLLSEIAASLPGLDTSITDAVNQTSQYVSSGASEQLSTQAKPLSLKKTGSGKETLKVKHSLSESAIGSATTQVTYTAQLFENGSGMETIQGQTLKLTRESAAGSASLSVKVFWTKNENGSSSEQLTIRWPLQETAQGREALGWTHYQNQLPPILWPRITEQGIELPIPYTQESIGQLVLGGIAPGMPQNASGPVTTAQQIPVGATYVFVFTRDTSLDSLDGTTNTMTFQIPDGRWYTGTARFAVTDLVSSTLTEVIATITSPIPLAQPQVVAMMY